MSSQEPVVDGKHVLVVTQVNPYTPVGGVTVVLRNLFSRFDPESYTFAYLGRFTSRGGDRVNRPDCHRLIPNYHPVQFLDFALKGTKRNYAIREAAKLAEARQSEIIMGLYPTLSSLDVATQVSKQTGARYFPYLHDTVAEGLSHTPMAETARKLQEDVFEQAEKVITMSEGMSDYYRKAYEKETYPLEHSFPEQITSEPNFERSRTAFWGGEVYSINDKSFSRAQKALLARRVDLEVTSLSKLDIEIETNVKVNFYPSREEYIEAVQRHGILLLGINWPDESDVHEAELSTIFPTKTIEYLATGSPILVHCPEDYFLARFIRERGCGVVVSEREGDALDDAIDFLLTDSRKLRDMQEKAIAVTRDYFSIARVASVLQSHLECQ
jgi:hypothetical protein